MNQPQPQQQVHVSVTITRQPGCLVALGRGSWAILYWALIAWWWLPMKWLTLGAWHGARWLIARYGWRGWLAVGVLFVLIIILGNAVGSGR